MNNTSEFKSSAPNTSIVPPADFKRRAELIISEYIKSAVLIDDDWPANNIRILEKNEINIGVTEDSANEADEEESDEEIDAHRAHSVEEEEISILLHSGKRVASDENAQRLVAIHDSFVSRGIICTGFKYTAREKENAPLLAKNADILILDWNFAGDNGAGALEILKHLKEGAQLRFVCIFTDQADLFSIKRAIFERLYGYPLPTAQDIDFKIGCFIFTLRNKAVARLESDHKSSVENLFDDAVSHIAQHYGGFLQLSMLEMTSRHRNTMLSHLTRFSRDFDAAILSDASQHGSPASLAENLRALLLDEWRIALEDSAKQNDMCILGTDGRAAYAASLAINTSHVTKVFFLKCISAMDFPFPEATLDKLFLVDESGAGISRKFDIEVGKWLSQGAIGNIPFDAKTGIKSKLTLAVFFVITHPELRDKTLDAATVWRDVLILDALFNQQLILPEEITQGTILKHDSDHYFICVTPLCDTAQLPDREGYNSYTFLAAKRVESNKVLSKATDYCVFVENGEPICLHVEIKRPYVFEIGPNSRKFGGVAGKLVTARHRLMPIFSSSAVEIVPLNEMKSLTRPAIPLTLAETEILVQPPEAPKVQPTSIEEPTPTIAALVANAALGKPILVASNTIIENAPSENLPPSESTSLAGPVPPGVATTPIKHINENSYSEIINFHVAGQLRTDFFLMLSTASASNASRVGVNRVEFIRAEKSK